MEGCRRIVGGSSEPMGIPKEEESLHTRYQRFNPAVGLSSKPDEILENPPRASSRALPSSRRYVEDDELAPAREGLPYDVRPEVLQKPGMLDSVNITGSKPLGSFIAANLCKMPVPPKITLNIRRPFFLQEWYREGEAVELIEKGQQPVYVSGMKAEFSHVRYEYEDTGRKRGLFFQTFGILQKKEDWPISMLIVTEAPAYVASALMPLRERLGPNSTICFPDHSIGVIDHVNSVVFPDASLRPRYIVGISRHSLAPTGRRFGVLQAAKGELLLSTMPVGHEQPSHGEVVMNELFKSTVYSSRSKTSTPSLCEMPQKNDKFIESSTSLLRIMTSCPDLVAIGLPYEEMLILQWEQIITDSIIHPLSVMFDCEYNQLAESKYARELITVLLTESLDVVSRLPEFEAIPREILRKRFSQSPMYSTILNKLAKLDGTSPMQQAVRKGYATDILFLNNYIAKKGQEVNIPCPVHRSLVLSVTAKKNINLVTKEEFIPYADRRKAKRS